MKKVLILVLVTVALGVPLTGTYHDYENSNTFSVECHDPNQTLSGTFGLYLLSGAATSCDLPCSLGFCIGSFSEVRFCWWGTIMKDKGDYKFNSFVASYTNLTDLRDALEIENLTNVFVKIG